MVGSPSPRTTRLPLAEVGAGEVIGRSLRARIIHIAPCFRSIPLMLTWKSQLLHLDCGPYLSREALPCYPTETLTDTRHVLLMTFPSEPST